MNIEEVLLKVRENVKVLNPYRSARDEFTDVADIYLDANENPYDLSYHRYPDPYQKELKKEISIWKEIEEERIFIGNGSDELIDLIIRAFCDPGVDSIVSLNPSYGMYSISAGIQNVTIRNYPLDADFSFETDKLIDFLEESDKVLFLCSPNNPPGNLISNDQIITLCDTFDGNVVIDEAYIDFAQGAGCMKLLSELSNLIIIQTLSKAMGAAGIRLGMGFMHSEIVKVLNKIKPPYNVNALTQEFALRRIRNRAYISQKIDEIITERASLGHFLTNLSFVEKVFPSEANFLLVRVKNANDLYAFLSSESIVVRNRSQQFRCEECLRITIGTPSENIKLKEALLKYENQFNKV